jgi:hypothetical protein
LIIDRLEHDWGVLKGVEYVGVGNRPHGYTCLQVRKPGALRLSHVEVGRIRRIEVSGCVLVPDPPNQHKSRASEIRSFFDLLAPQLRVGQRSELKG